MSSLGKRSKRSTFNAPRSRRSEFGTLNVERLLRSTLLLCAAISSGRHPGSTDGSLQPHPYLEASRDLEYFTRKKDVRKIRPALCQSSCSPAPRIRFARAFTSPERDRRAAVLPQSLLLALEFSSTKASWRSLRHVNTCTSPVVTRLLLASFPDAYRHALEPRFCDKNF
jgi:hypothetical protein